MSHNVLCCVTMYCIKTQHCIVYHPIEPVIPYKTSQYIIISPILSLSQQLQCLDLQLMLFQSKRGRGVNWVKDRGGLPGPSLLPGSLTDLLSQSGQLAAL